MSENLYVFSVNEWNKIIIDNSPKQTNTLYLFHGHTNIKWYKHHYFDFPLKGLVGTFVEYVYANIISHNLV